MFNLSICVVLKNEALYLEEWIEYHKLIGVEHFYIYDNRSNDNTLPIYEKYKDIITVRLWNLDNWQQKLAYIDYCTKYEKDSIWTAFIDVDEFIAYKGKKTLVNYLKENNIDSLEIPWMIFGTNGHVERPKGLVLENYTAAHSVSPNIRGKIICKSSLIDIKHIESPHRFNYTSSNINKQKGNYDSVYLHHYMLKSEEDLYIKYSKGDVWNHMIRRERLRDIKGNVRAALDKYNKTDIIVDHMLKYVPQIKGQLVK
jgi:hypothetical protein